MSLVENKGSPLLYEHFAHMNFNNGAYTLGLPFECEVYHPKSIPNKNDHMGTKIEKNEGDAANFASGSVLVRTLLEIIAFP
jgi:hypothetical protein